MLQVLIANMICLKTCIVYQVCCSLLSKRKEMFKLLVDSNYWMVWCWIVLSVLLLTFLIIGVWYCYGWKEFTIGWNGVCYSLQGTHDRWSWNGLCSWLSELEWSVVQVPLQGTHDRWSWNGVCSWSSELEWSVVQVRLQGTHDHLSWNGVCYRYGCKALTIVEFGMEFARDRQSWNKV